MIVDDCEAEHGRAQVAEYDHEERPALETMVLLERQLGRVLQAAADH